MALWHLYRMETDPNVGPLSLSCAESEVVDKFTLYDSNNQVYDATTACVDRDATAGQILTLLTGAGYDPSEWHS